MTFGKLVDVGTRVSSVRFSIRGPIIDSVRIVRVAAHGESCFICFNDGAQGRTSKL